MQPDLSNCRKDEKMNIAYEITVVAMCMLAAVIFIWYLISAWCYRHTAYYDVTHASFSKMRFNAGSYGEYQVYKRLKRFEKRGARFLFNCYVPKKENETAEIDLLMIYYSGIYVFESKNYGGYIYGSEERRMWTQVFPGSGENSKKQFYNPIMQNASHVRSLRKMFSAEIPMHSVIVFSNRCTLKKIEMESRDIKVCKRDRLPSVIRKLNRRTKTFLEEEEINEIYNKLYPYTQVGTDIKKKHIKNVKNSVKKAERKR